MKCQVLCALSLALVLLLPSLVQAAVTVQPNEAASKDVFVYQGFANNGFDTGSAGFGSGFGQYLSAGLTGDGHDTKALLQFDLSTISAQYTAAQVAAGSAKLTLQVIPTSGSGFGNSPDATRPVTIDLSPITSSWSESTTTFSGQPTAGASVASAVISNVNVPVTFEINSLVSQWLSGSLANNGLVLTQRSVVGTPGGNLYVALFDSSAGTVAPSLTVVPEPASVALALTALPLLVWQFRRRKTAAA